VLAEQLIARLPEIDGEPDAAYLSAALKRAGRPANVDRLESAAVDGGRVSSNVFSLRSRAGSFVLKKFVPEAWRMRLFGTAFNEPALWAHGLTRDLPSPLACPTIDAAHHRAHGECWILMDDVSAGIAPRGSFDEGAFRRVLDGLARLHARYWGRTAELAKLPLLTLEQHAAAFAEPSAAAGGRPSAADWVPEMLEKVFLFRRFVPPLLEVLGPADGDLYLDLCQHRDRWLAPLSRVTQTVVHGDIRRANVAVLSSGTVSLFDWDFATRAPAAADLTHYWFLHFWCYPPNDGKSPEDRDPLKRYYRDRLEESLGGLDHAEFERAWDLCWLKSLAQVGFCLADPLVGNPSPEEVARVRARCAKAIGRARRILDAHAA
jgi:hypothetical protein